MEANIASREGNIEANKLPHNTILIVLGPSSAGKSTYIYNNYISHLSGKNIPILIDYELKNSDIQNKLLSGEFKDSPVIIHFNTLIIYENNKRLYDINFDFRKSPIIKFLLENKDIKERLQVHILCVDRKTLINRIASRNHVEPLLFPEKEKDRLNSYPSLSLRQLLKRIDLDKEHNKWCNLWTEEGVPFSIIKSS